MKPTARAAHRAFKLPAVRWGYGQFRGDSPPRKQARYVPHGVDHGITHFDLANNYRPARRQAPSEALARSSKPISRLIATSWIISSKAGLPDMWPGPYGEFGSRKYLMASCDASLKRDGGLDYVESFIPTVSTLKRPLEGKR